MENQELWMTAESDDIWVARDASAGLQTSRFYALSSLSGIQKEALAPLLESSLKTISRYHEQGKKLSPSESEKVLMLEQLFKWGHQIFASPKDFEYWLQRPSFGLQNKVPFSLLSTITGIRAVIAELKNIATGNLS
jgi:putative toxin-antitoxin system antitoxin component (TIGR02293 family)